LNNFYIFVSNLKGESLFQKIKIHKMVKTILDNIKYIAFLVFFYGLYYFGSYGIDCYWRPWAYSTSKSTQLFVGKWAGEFKDPNGVSKKMDLEIFIPLSHVDRLFNGINCNAKNQNKKTRKGFDGVATVKSVLGVEKYRINGGFKDTDFQQFFFAPTGQESFSVDNYYLKETENDCTWEGDKLKIIMPLAFQIAGKSGYWSSSDDRFAQQVSFVLKRQ
jgi:hypothetical protein